MLVHLRLNVPTDLTDTVRDTLSDDARLTNLTHLRGASLKPAGDVFEADVAREAATAVLDDLNAVGLGHRGGIVIDQPLGTPFDAAHDVAEGGLGATLAEMALRFGVGARIGLGEVAERDASNA